MIDLHSPADLELLRESIDLECKLAAGREGQGALPEDFWPTYSAFANSNGGVVLLGVREKKGQFFLEGIANPAKVRKELFDNLNNRQKVSINLLSDADVRGGYLESHNPGRGAVYCLPGAGLPTPEDVFGGSSEYLTVSSEHLSDSSGHLPDSAERDACGRILTEKLDAPLIDDLTRLSPDFHRDLCFNALWARTSRKLDSEEMQRTILSVCRGHYITGTCLAELLQRNGDSLRKQHLKPLLQSGRLRLAFPTKPTHQMQAYRTTESE